MKAWLIQRLGGYPDIDSAVEAIRDRDLLEKYKILTLAVKKLFNTIGAEDILHENEFGQWLASGKPISEGEKKLLQAEAVQLLGMKLWKVLQDDVKYQANKKMFILAENEMQVATGKFWLYTLDTMKTRLESLNRGKGSFNSNK